MYDKRALIGHVCQCLAAQFAQIVSTPYNYRTVRYVAPVNITMACGLAVYHAVFPFQCRWFHASHTNPASGFVARRLGSRGRFSIGAMEPVSSVLSLQTYFFFR